MSENPEQNTEVEVKLALASRADYLRLLERLGTPRERIIQSNTFYDSSTGAWAAAQVALRLRTETISTEGPPDRQRALLTLKCGGSVHGDVFSRGEIECDLPLSALEDLRANPLRFLELDVPPIRALRERLPEVRDLVALGGFENLRWVYPMTMEIGGRKFTGDWEVDQTTFPGGRIDYELEMELEDESTAQAASAVIQARLDALGVRYHPQPTGKYTRFRASMNL